MKKCSKCKEEKQASDFYKDGRRDDGLQSQCKLCVLKYHKARYKNFPDFASVVKKRMSIWRKNNPDKYKKQLIINTEKISRFRKDNLEQSRKNDKIKREKNKEAIRETAKRWRKNHPDRARENGRINQSVRRARKKASGGKFTLKEWKSMLEYYNYTCLCCKRTDLRLEIDHVMPLSLGGIHSKENIQPLCYVCNGKKWANYIDYRKDFENVPPT